MIPGQAGENVQLQHVEKHGLMRLQKVGLRAI